MGFEPRNGRSIAWAGRYARIPGDTTAFHVRRYEGSMAVVLDHRDGYDTELWVMREDARQMKSLVEAVNRAKHRREGGVFAINEHGHVIVPSGVYDGSPAHVGRWIGPLRFEDPFGEVHDLSDGAIVATGAPWHLPYLGIPHNLSGVGQLYFWRDDDQRERKLLPPVQDQALISAIRRVRPHGPVRFITCYGGHVVTKVPTGPASNPRWEPRYVSRLNASRWFADGH